MNPHPQRCPAFPHLSRCSECGVNVFVEPRGRGGEFRWKQRTLWPQMTRPQQQSLELKHSSKRWLARCHSGYFTRSNPVISFLRDAWNSLGNMSKEDAMVSYVNEIKLVRLKRFNSPSFIFKMPSIACVLMSHVCICRSDPGGHAHDHRGGEVPARHRPVL